MSKFIKAIHDKPNLTVQYVSDNGSILLRSGGTIAWRFNNPGNMRPKSNGKYHGQIGIGDTKSGKFVIFESYSTGRAEKKALLRRKYNQYSLKDAIYIYAPPNENNTEEYIDFLVRETSIQRATLISNLDESQLEKLMDAMQEKEGFNGQLNTRKEKLVNTTVVNVTDGTQPLSEQKITVTIGGERKELITNSLGNLPLIPHITVGEKIIFSTFVNGVDQVIGEVITSLESQAVTLINRSIRYTTKLISQNGISTTSDNKVFKYTVASGDNLTKIAKRFRVTTHEIETWNRLKNPNQVFPGQILTIGDYAHQDLSNNSDSILKIYKVRQNDSVYKICKTFKISENDFLKANPQIKDKILIRIGENVNIPNTNQTFNVAESSNQSSTSNAHLASKDTEILSQVVDIKRSKNGKGEALAILPLNNKEAPWMPIVLREIKQWYGKKESTITKIDNYHELTGTKLNTMVGSKQAWCASFVNYCLQEAKFAKSYQPASALSFRRDNKNFVNIQAPIFGALATIPTSKGASADATNGVGHVAFVYSLDKENGRFIMIGGNQDDQITIVDKNIASFRFYVPKAYYEFAKTQTLEKKMSVDEVYNLLGLKTVKTGNGTR